MPMPRANENNIDIDSVINSARERIAEFLEQYSTRILIDSRSARSAGEMMKPRLTLYENELNQIAKISDIMDKIANTSREEYIELKKELRDIVDQLRYLEHEERRSLKNGIEIFLKHVSKKYPTQFVSQEEFERRQKQYDTQKQNSLRKIFSIFAKEKAAAKDQGQSGRRI